MLAPLFLVLLALVSCQPRGGIQLTPAQEAAFSAYMNGNLSGLHLRITVIHHSLATNTGYDDPALIAKNELRPSSEWTGFWVDMIDWVAMRGGFTYSLHVPSGNGTDCVLPPGEVHGPRAYASQFNCGAIPRLTRTPSQCVSAQSTH
jgi:hypothetical protein